ncbi:hypothetical protein RQP46_010690 [Phenoliferia psychrophenolica]
MHLRSKRTLEARPAPVDPTGPRSRSPPPTGPCLIALLPPELMAHIRDLSLEGLDAFKIQLLTHNLQAVSRSFYHAFNQPHQVVVTTPTQAVNLARAIRGGKSPPKSICIMLGGSGPGRSGKYADLVRECRTSLVDLEIWPRRDQLGQSGDSLGKPLRMALSLLSIIESFTTNEIGWIYAEDFALLLSSWSTLKSIKVPSLEIIGSITDAAALEKLPTGLRDLEMPVKTSASLSSITRTFLESYSQTLRSLVYLGASSLNAFYPHMNELVSLKVHLAAFPGTPSPIFDVLSRLPRLRNLSLRVGYGKTIPFTSEALIEFLTLAKSLKTFEIIEPRDAASRFHGANQIWSTSKMKDLRDAVRDSGVCLTIR